LMTEVATKEHLEASRKIRDIMATYYDAKDLIDVGAYSKGTDPKIDKAIELIDEINAFLRQEVDEKSTFEDTINHLIEIANKI